MARRPTPAECGRISRLALDLLDDNPEWTAAQAQDEASRRVLFRDRSGERHIRFIQAAGRPGAHVVRVGDLVLPLTALNEDTLADVAERVRADFWLSRRIDRENRAVRAQRARAA